MGAGVGWHGHGLGSVLSRLLLLLLWQHCLLCMFPAQASTVSCTCQHSDTCPTCAPPLHTLTLTSCWKVAVS
jgi:hypothetical protein